MLKCLGCSLAKILQGTIDRQEAAKHRKLMGEAFNLFKSDGGLEACA